MGNRDDIEIALLSAAGCARNVIEHCLAVKTLATTIARGIDGIDAELVRRGALLHDIGRSKTHNITHAVEGVRIATSMGIEQPVIDIIERHIGSGISKEEARELGLPVKDYFPITREEKLISCADSLISGTRIMSFEETIAHIRRILGAEHPAVERFRALHQEIQSWIRP
ncbi:TIGR00295 family protein [Candidatus Magnetobacterium casense]|uniref:TIGR00295 family protein n=1 Tax=Candidatus Magnetobacterium casense TaxID=1455061 RepID=A0ABS6RX96_9BACT|nr:TIGR00295 family protein [Candidatus Magnetobacterium casensis]MBV6341255.1 TIGR00295 family protein [Candidatus Magnetobacterium casensis]